MSAARGSRIRYKRLRRMKVPRCRTKGCLLQLDHRGACYWGVD